MQATTSCSFNKTRCTLLQRHADWHHLSIFMSTWSLTAQTARMRVELVISVCNRWVTCSAAVLYSQQAYRTLTLKQALWSMLLDQSGQNMH
jgi:hypothetical protein